VPSGARQNSPDPETVMSDAYGDLPVLDLTDPAWWRRPAELTAPMHERGAVAAFVPAFDTVSFLRYDDCLRALTDQRLAAMGARYFEMQGWTEGPFVDWIRLNVVMMNPPGHTRLRALVTRAFTPKAVASMREVSQRVARELCDEVDASGGTVEFVHDWARVLPLRVVCEMIGIPTVDVTQMAEWAEGLAVASGMADVGAREAGDRAMQGFSAYVSSMIDERGRSRRDDLLSALIDVEESGDRLAMDELVAMVVQLIFAGHETTQNLVGNGMYRLLEHPEQFALLAGEPGRIPAAVEEMLRYDPPIIFTSRIATEAIEVAGLGIGADQLVMLNLTAANHDPVQFPEPERFDVTRPEVRHLSFGHGVHFCLGAALARLEARVVFEELLSRIPDWHVEPDQVTWVRSSSVRGPASLPCEFTP
jgi:cytochrome P450